MDNPDGTFSIELNRAPITWDLAAGTVTFFGIPLVSLWLDPSLLRLLEPLAKEVGIPLFRLLVAHEASLGTAEDYHAMVTTLGSTFEEGFLAWGSAVSAAGWGRFELPMIDRVGRRAVVRIHNPWEMLMHGSLPPEERWGCPFLQGKIIGLFTHAFGETCWADEVEVRAAPGECWVDLHVHASQRTIAAELDVLRREHLEEGRRRLDARTRELRESEEQQRAIFASLSEVVFTLDREGRFTSYHCPKHLAATYPPPAAVIGRRADDVLSAKVAAQLLAAMEEVIAGDAPATLTYSHVFAGAQRFLSTTMSPLRGPTGELRGATAVERDVTDRVLAERALAERLSVIEAQREAIRALSTPIIQVWSGVLALPIIGEVDARRAAQLTEGLLDAILGAQARYAILDLTGVDTIDTASANHFFRIIRAAELLGARCIVCGIRPAVARMMSTLGIGTDRASVFATMQGALESVIQAAWREGPRPAR